MPHVEEMPDWLTGHLPALGTRSGDLLAATPTDLDLDGAFAEQWFIASRKKAWVVAQDAEGAARLTGPSGVIPVPEDWATAFQFAWLDYTGDPETPVADTDPALWVNIEDGPAAMTQMLFATPLTAQQMSALGASPP